MPAARERGVPAGVIVAAGTGQRLGHDVPKAFVPLAGTPLLLHAVRAFSSTRGIEALVCVVPAAFLDRAQEILDGADLGVRVCAGGESRRESVARGLAACPQRVDVVAVHDAARPLVTPTLVERVLAALEPPWDAAAPGMPVVDTLKLVTDDTVVRTVDRDGLWAVQTPQVFHRDVLERAHARATGTETDDLAIVERDGARVRLVLGERRNFKITYPEDLAFAEALATGAPP